MKVVKAKTKIQRILKMKIKSNSAGKRSKGNNSDIDANSDKDKNSKNSHKSSKKDGENNEDKEFKEESDNGEQDRNLFNVEEVDDGDEKFNKPSESPKQIKTKQDKEKEKEKVIENKKTNSELIPKALNKDLEKAAKGDKDEYGKVFN
jgi:hypothetical protein